MWKAVFGGDSSTSLSEARSSILVTQRNSKSKEPPSHHVLSWTTGSQTGFKNPWKSFHKPGPWEILRNSTNPRTGDPPADDSNSSSKLVRVDEPDAHERETETVSLVSPQWGGPWPQGFSHSTVRGTWLGHAGALVQFPPIAGKREQINVIIDPIFSERSSPSQNAGPIRIVSSPCLANDLPPVHIVLLSHNHYDHADLTTLLALYKIRKHEIHFFVPLNNSRMLTSTGIPASQVTEADWWDEYDVSFDTENPSLASMRVVCVPAQHNSGRWGWDSNNTLWSGWLVESLPGPHPSSSSSSSSSIPSSLTDSISPSVSAASSENKPIRVFFGGDTGLRYRDPNKQEHEWSYCPAFQELVERYGSPHLSFLPISVGGTFTYVKSFDPLPNAGFPGWSLVPEIPEALTSSTHMSPGDAVALHRILSGENKEGKEKGRTISVAIHFGTFCSGPAESRQSVRTLRGECRRQNVRFAKFSDGKQGTENHAPSVVNETDEGGFIVLDHGGTVEIRI